MDFPAGEELQRLVEAALAEDVGAGDLTTQATVPAGCQARGHIVARERLVVAGLRVAEAVFGLLSPSLQTRRAAGDGQWVQPGDTLLHLAGPAAALLTGERVALNFLQRLSGIATLTRLYVEAVAGTPAVILDTRKTTPGLRRLEKYAVTCGGGRNHRAGLFDAVLIKDNHLVVLRQEPPNPIAAAVRRARAGYPAARIEVEADGLAQVEQAVAAGADVILLDNMDPVQLRQAVQIVGGRAKTEASGGINLSNVRQVAEAGVDAISIGALTHSARAVDLALDFSPGEASAAVPA
jgi:nicotinate-nucleotide pyrophosphorylase (carboxylating)